MLDRNNRTVGVAVCLKSVAIVAAHVIVFVASLSTFASLAHASLSVVLIASFSTLASLINERERK
jgi:hypothetical protein